MQTERVFNRRVDYLRVAISGEPAAVLATCADYARLCGSYPTAVHGRSTGKSFKEYPGQSKNTHTWVKIFETWGDAADVLAHHLSAEAWRGVTRMDWREEVDTPPLSLRELEDRAHRFCQGALRITRDVSRLRSRRNGRDGGGELLGVGSHASDTRLTVYKRGTAEYAVEAQLSGKQLTALIAQGFFEHSQEPYPDMYDLMKKIASRKLRELVQLRLSMPFDVLASKEGFDNQAEMLSLLDLPAPTYKEQTLQLLDNVPRETIERWIAEYYDESSELLQTNVLRLLPIEEYTEPVAD